MSGVIKLSAIIPSVVAPAGRRFYDENQIYRGLSNLIGFNLNR
jgi:hypothetical protein